MASSQVEIPSPSQSFGFILRDRNQNRVVYKKAQVKDNHHHENLVDSWIQALNKKKDVIATRSTEKKPAVLKSSPVETVKEIKPDESNKNNGASSLVQIWEARLLNRTSGGNSPSHNQSSPPVNSSRSDSGVSVQDSRSSESPPIDNNGDSEAEVSDDAETESSRSHGGSVSDSCRVADLIRRLSNEAKLVSGWTLDYQDAETLHFVLVIFGENGGNTENPWTASVYRSAYADGTRSPPRVGFAC